MQEHSNILFFPYIMIWLKYTKKVFFLQEILKLSPESFGILVHFFQRKKFNKGVFPL